MDEREIFPPNRRPSYKPSPQMPTVYSGPETPTNYDPNWQYFKNLTPEQIAWFQAQPEWKAFAEQQPNPFPNIPIIKIK